MSQPLPTIERDAFAAWLKQQEPDQAVYLINPCGCWIARWLQHLTGDPEATCTSTHGIIRHQRVDLPQWAQDAQQAWGKAGFGFRPLTATAALSILESVP